MVSYELSSSGPGPGPRSGPGQVSGLLQVRSIRSKDKDQRPGPGLYIKIGLTLYPPAPSL